MILWIVGFFRDPECNEVGGIWEIVGVYDSESKAVEACKDWRYFVGPMELNFTAPVDKTEWPGSYYPIIIEEDE